MTHRGFRARGRGDHIAPHSSIIVHHNGNEILNNSVPGPKSSTPRPSSLHRTNHLQSNGSDGGVSVTPLVGKHTENVPNGDKSYDTGVMPSSHPKRVSHQASPPAILRTSLEDFHHNTAVNPKDTQFMLVDKVIDASHTFQGDNDRETGDSGESDEEMSDDEEPNDLITLDQYQEGACKETLARKGSHILVVSQKKGRVDTGDKGSVTSK